MPIDVHTLEQIDGSSFLRSDRVVVGAIPAQANAAGSGAGASVTTAVAFAPYSLPPAYSVQITPSQPALVSVTNKTSSGFNVVLTPLSSSTTLAAGTFDVLVVA